MNPALRSNIHWCLHGAHSSLLRGGIRHFQASFTHNLIKRSNNRNLHTTAPDHPNTVDVSVKRANLEASQSQTPSRDIPPISENIKALLPLLKSQPFHYITIHIHGKPYLVTVGDKIRLPFRMPDVEPGDILRLNRASHLGSRDFTLCAPQQDKDSGEYSNKRSYIDEDLFLCRAVVMGTESEPMRIKEKTKRRQRHVRQVKSKHKYTILRLRDLQIRSINEVAALKQGSRLVN